MILLVDPLPVISEEKRWTLRSKKDDGGNRVSETSSIPEDGILGVPYDADAIEEPQRVTAKPTSWQRLALSQQRRERGKTKDFETKENKKTELRVLVEQMAPRKAISPILTMRLNQKTS